jgi:acyl-CoA thioesterase I
MTDWIFFGGRRGRLAYGHGWRLRQVLLALALVCCGGGPVSARALHIVALGDSLTAGHLLPEDAAFPTVLQKAVRAKGFDVEIVNAGVSGDTSSDVLARLDWSVPAGTDGVILEIGANDMLRGLDPRIPRRNIDAILSHLQKRKIPVLIAGMKAAPNLDADFAQKFDPLYAELAKKYDAPLYPFFLDGVAGQPKNQLPDGLHPNRRGVETIVAKILPIVTAWLDALQQR